MCGYFKSHPLMLRDACIVFYIDMAITIKHQMSAFTLANGICFIIQYSETCLQRPPL